MPVPAPPPRHALQPGTPQPGLPQSGSVQSGLPEPGSAEPQSDVLDEVRSRLDGLDERPLHEHPEQFAAVDQLLRSALDGSGAAR